MELDNFRKLFPQLTSKFPGRFSEMSALLRRRKAHDVAIEGLGTKKIGKVDICRADAISENGPIESWPYLLVKHTKFSTKRPFQLSIIQNVLAHSSKPAVTARRGVFELEKNLQTSKFPGEIPETEKSQD